MIRVIVWSWTGPSAMFVHNGLHTLFCASGFVTQFCLTIEDWNRRCIPSRMDIGAALFVESSICPRAHAVSTVPNVPSFNDEKRHVNGLLGIGRICNAFRPESRCVATTFSADFSFLVHFVVYAPKWVCKRYRTVRKEMIL